jgi:hypothetical protein
VDEVVPAVAADDATLVPQPAMRRRRRSAMAWS